MLHCVDLFRYEFFVDYRGFQNSEGTVNQILKNFFDLKEITFESHSQSANGLKRSFGVKNDKYGPCHGADFYKNDTLSRSQNAKNDTLFSGTSPYRKIYEHPPPSGVRLSEMARLRRLKWSERFCCCCFLYEG